MTKNPPSLARSFFERITSGSDPAGQIRAFVGATPPVFETEFLDFKCEPENDDKVKELWSKAVAGFANTEGGVLVWGIDARKDKTHGIDAAHGLRAIRNTARLKTRLTELLRDAADPPLPGVEIVEIPECPGAAQGFVVCFIPEGDFKPYRAEHAGKQWYHRVADSFHVLNRSLLASLFHPRSNPRLWISMTVEWEVLPESRAEFVAWVTVHNDGNASAKDVLLRINAESGTPDSMRATADKQWSSIVVEKPEAAFRSEMSIHPKTLVRACRLEWQTDVCNGSEPRPA
jgi:hypothetical protein